MNVASAADLQVKSLSPMSRVQNSLYITYKMRVRNDKGNAVPMATVAVMIILWHSTSSMKRIK